MKCGPPHLNRAIDKCILKNRGRFFNMVYVISSIILFVVFLAGAIGIIANYKHKYGSKVYFSILAAPLAFLILLFGSFTTVGANEVGIIFDELNGGVLEETYGQGLHAKSPFRHVTTISTTNRTSYIEVYSQTEDSIFAKFEITVIYNIETNNAGLFYRTTGSVDISSQQLNSIVKKNLQSITTQHNIFDIMGVSLEEVRAAFRDVLSNDLMNIYHITLVSVSIDDVDAGTEIEQIIQDKAKAIQQIEIAQQEKARQDVINETNRIKAEIDAEIALIKAQSDFAVAEKQAEAQAVLNAAAVNAIQTMYDLQFETPAEKLEFETNGTGGYLTIQEVSTIVIKQLYYDVWDGKLPTVITDGSGIIIQP